MRSLKVAENSRNCTGCCASRLRSLTSRTESEPKPSSCTDSGSLCCMSIIYGYIPNIEANYFTFLPDSKRCHSSAHTLVLVVKPKLLADPSLYESANSCDVP